MRVYFDHVKPDTLTKGLDFVIGPSKDWEPVQNAYWSDLIQRYVVMCGPLGYGMVTCTGKIYRKRIYLDG